MTADQTFVIVGAGLTGAKAAETLRAEGFDGHVVLVGAERERPYHRPPLSKGYLRGESLRERIDVHEPGFYADHDIELLLSRPAVRLDASSRELTLDDGERLSYDRLLLATGAEPRRLAVPGADLDGVLYLRSVEDSDALRERLAACRSAVVVGAGWIGSEVAASARMLGVDVAMIGPGQVPLERVLGSVVGGVYHDLHVHHGVRMMLGAGVEAIEGSAAVERVRVSDGRTVDCDLVIVGVGAEPRTALAAAAGLAVDNGIRVDEHLETGIPGVFAAGDVANAHHPFYRRPVRVEHWANARHQGPLAARTMLGAGDVYDRLPRFSSQQYDSSMAYVGLARSWDRVVLRGDPAGGEFIAFWLLEGRVVAGMSVNSGDVADDLERLIRERCAVDDRRLADPDHELGELVPAVRS